MSNVYAIRPPDPQPMTLEDKWRQRINQAREHRRQFEPTWLSNLAFAAGQHWLVWDPQHKRMRHISDMDSRWRNRELYTADRINEQRQAQLGELQSGDDRPELLLAQNGTNAAEIQEHLNQAVAYGWEYEWRSDEALDQARQLCMDLGVSAIRVRFDPTLGPTVANVVHHDGQPVFDPEQARALLADGPRPDVQVKSIHEGRTVWEPLSSFNLLTPPGVNHEDYFPWEVVVRPVLIDKLIEQYGDAARSLTEDTDIASIIGLSTVQAEVRLVDAAARGRLRNHVWLFTCYERPCQTYPDGQTIVLASNAMRVMDVQQTLPYAAPDQSRRSGVHYFHWWRLNDRFWSRSFVEPMKDPQRIINRRELQNIEIIDRGMPKVFTTEGDLPHDPVGVPLELIELKADAKPPQFFNGVGPGPWMYEDIAHHQDNLAHASTLSPLRLGENPQSIDTYSSLALLNETEAVKRSRLLLQHERAKAGCVEDSVYDIRRYWPPQKQILVAGDEGSFSETLFEKSKVPDFFVVKVAKGAAQPRSQGAELTKIDAIWSAAHATGVVAGPNAQRWTDWYARSVDAAQAQDIPEEETDSQAVVAQYENYVMLHDGTVPPPADHDVMPIHIPIHREQLDQARAAGDHDTAARVQQHIDWSIQVATVARKQWRFNDPTDLTDTATELALDEDQALRENQMMLNGIPLNPEALQQAVAQLQQHINPDTGQQVQPTDDLRMLLVRASLKPTLIENLTLHLERHGNVVKSAEFQTFPPEVRERFLTHFDLTRELYLSLPLLPEKMTPPRVSMSLRGDVGESTVAKILHRGGVPEADPNEIGGEPPLETLVSVVDQLKDAPVDDKNPEIDGANTGAAPPPPAQ